MDVSDLAVIIEKYCIGCTKCIQACPVDAIVGAAKQMHTVIEEECTGCELCRLPPCPVDCIELHPVKTVIGKSVAWMDEQARNKTDRADLRTTARLKRLDRIKTEEAELRAARAKIAESSARKKEIRAAVARAKAKKAERAELAEKSERSKTS